MKIKKNNIIYPQKRTVYIPKINPLKDYYQSTIGKKSTLSPPEARIRDVLKSKGVFFIRECSFRNFGHPIAPYRFDFYLPEYEVVIEYDGKHHSKAAFRKNDRLKNQFCKKNHIRIYRYAAKHYASLELYINRLCKTLRKINR